MRVTFITAAIAAIVVGTAAFADLPSLPNPNWSYGETTTTTETTTTPDTRDFNRASEASTGRASDRNKSDFRETTITTTTTTTETTPAINPGGQVDPNRSVSDTTVESSTDTTVEKVH